MNVDDIVLDELSLFRELTIPQLELLRSVSQVRLLASGEAMMEANQPGDRVYFIIEGSVKVCVPSREGPVLVAIRGPGEVIGEMSVLDGSNRSATVIAQEKCTALWVSQESFWNVLWEFPPFSYNLTCILAQRLRVLTSQVQAMATLDVRERLARQLVTLAHEYGRSYNVDGGRSGRLIPFNLSQAELASMIGSNRPQVNQILANWKRRQFIATQGHRIVVFDADALRYIYEGPAPNPTAKE